MVSRSALATILALAAGCGVDRAPEGASVIVLALDVPSPSGSGGAVRDARGLFDLEHVGVYAAVTVDAEDIDPPVVEDWPDAASPALVAEIEMLVPAGQGRSFEVLALVFDDEDGLSAHSGGTTRDLAGGTEIDLDIHLEPLPTSAVDVTIAIPEGMEEGEVLAVHPVDVEHDVLYRAAAFTAADGSLSVHAGALPRGRTVRWTIHAISGEWMDAAEETPVP